VPRNTSSTTALECVGGPFDGDAIACGDGARVEVSWANTYQGSYVHGRQGERRVLVWVPG
jgi:hypothetical protein